MPTSYRRRPAPCSHCGDVVLVVERSVGRLLGLDLGWTPNVRLEHAEAGPSGEIDDPVDEGCRRPRVAG